MSARITALELHLPAHRLDQIDRRHDVLDFDTVVLTARRRNGGIDDAAY